MNDSTPRDAKDDEPRTDIHRAANDLEKDGYAPFARWLRKWAQTNT